MRGVYPRVFDREEKVRIIKALGISGFCLRNKGKKIIEKVLSFSPVLKKDKNIKS